MGKSKKILADFFESAGIGLNGDNPWDIQVHDGRFYDRFLSQGELGLGEAYMAHWWECDQVDEFIYRLLQAKIHAQLKERGGLLLHILRAKFLNLQNVVRARVVADTHYNLSNAFYQLVLDESMAYSCAYWKDADSLSQAQRNKYDLVCRKLNLSEGDHVLEHGMGWGGFAKYATENYGCNIVGVTNSSRQIEYAKELCKDLPVAAYCCDYRDQHIYNPDNRKFDKIVSIGMCEHVGPKNYRGWFEIVNMQLKDDGLFLLHTIGSDVSVAINSRFNQKYIFPNSHAASLKQLSSAAESIFSLQDFHNFSHYYLRTVQEWEANFTANWDKIQQLDPKFDDTFYRMWEFYLLGGMAVVKARRLSLWQMVFSKIGFPIEYEGVR